MSVPKLRRGVWRAPYTIDGCPVLLAVTSTGDRFKKIVVLRPGVSEERAAAWFEEVLDRIDPVGPKLQLVAPPAPPKQMTVADLDALYRDADPIRRLLWERKKARIYGGSYG